MNTPNPSAADGVTSRISFAPDYLADDPDTTTPHPPPKPPAPAQVPPVADILAMLRANPYIVDSWQATMGDYQAHPPETIARHIFDNPQLHPLLATTSLKEAPEWGRGWARPRSITTTSPWFQVAQWWAENQSGGCYIYDGDPKSRSWWWFDGVRWHMLANTDPRLMDEIARSRYAYVQQLEDAGRRDAADKLSDDGEWRWARSSNTHDFGAGLRHHLGGAMPQPEPHHKATPSGVVDLRTGLLLPHAPGLWTRAVTLGDYLPTEVEAHMAALLKRFGNGKVFSPETLTEYLRLIGLALTGLAQSYRAIVLVVGESGSGKGDAANVAQRALGSLGHAIAREWLAQKSRSDIDATSTDLLEHQPCIIRVDELGSDTDVAPSRLMSFTGNAPTSSRRPHGPVISGTITGQLWATSVQPPAIPRNSGIERRLAVLPTLRKLAESEKDEQGGFAPELMNAVVTMAMKYAGEVYLQGYAAPQGDLSAKYAVLSDMDEIATWLEQQDDLQGIGVSEAWRRARTQLGKTDRELTQTLFGRRIGTSKRWEKVQLPGGVRAISARGQTPPTTVRRPSMMPLD